LISAFISISKAEVGSSKIIDAILDIAQSGKTVILVTHELDFARNVADSIVFINKGEILEITESEEFFTNPKTNRAKEFLDKAVYKKTKN
jgi:polar amino acid transport system ATP-binding protein